MQKIEWQPFMDMDDAALDNERRRLLDILNVLADPAVTHDRDAVTAVLADLRALAERVFAAEEETMRGQCYRQSVWHARQHDVLRRHFETWAQRVADDWRLGTGANAFLTLVPLVIRHFGEVDRNFSHNLHGYDICWKTAA